jgi:hypothetical protein
MYMRSLQVNSEEISKKYIQFSEMFNVKPNIKISELYRIKNLSFRGKLAFEAAEVGYQSIMNKEWIDSGNISLAYFKILEIEFNNRFIKPLFQNINHNDLRKNLENEKGLTGNFIRSIDTIIKNLEKNNYTLTSGQIFYFLTNILENNQTNFSKYFIHKIEEILTDLGLVELHNGELFNMFNDKFREKYRNPPAHTLYLSKDQALEARQFVIKNLNYLSDKFKF